MPILRLNKPIYIGFTVLELSKWVMHDFHYKFMTLSFMIIKMKWPLAK